MRPMLLALGLLPGSIAAILLPVLLARPMPPFVLLLWRIALALPVVMLPLLLALGRMQRHQSRAAAGLGANWLDRLRWLWLPQLGLGIMVSLLLAVLFAMLFTPGGALLLHRARFVFQSRYGHPIFL